MTHPENSTTTAFRQYQYDGTYSDGAAEMYWNRSRNALIEKKLRSFNSPSQVIFDIGCGRGISVDYLLRQGFEAYGTDPGTPDPYSKAVSPFLYLGGDLSGIPETIRDRVDTLTFLDVLEHIPEPSILMKDALEKFKNVKNILITLPSRQEVWSNYDEFYGHFKRYSLKDAKELTASFPLICKEAGYFFKLQYIPMLFYSFFKIRRNVNLKPPASFNLFFHRALTLYFKLENLILPKKWYGSSLFICLEKKK